MGKVKDTRKELRNLKDADLEQRLKELKDKLRDLTFKTQSDEIRNVHEMRSVKKDVARVLTLIREKSRIK